MEAVICDVQDCDEFAGFHVSTTQHNEEWGARFTFDACSVAHISAYLLEAEAALKEVQFVGRAGPAGHHASITSTD